MKRYEFKEIGKKVIFAIDIFFKNDSLLLEINASERTISHKLAEYLQTQFPEWHVDCEYNRKENEIKRLNAIEECSEQKRTDRIFPDIIIHHRRVNENLLVIEVKSNQDDLCDRRKLKLLTQKNGEYGYDWGLYIQFNNTEKPNLTWYKEGLIYEQD
jgi:hypothetical protein